MTAPATAATLTIANNKTLTVSSSLTLAGTDSTTMTFPSGSDTVAGLATAETFSAADIFSANGAASAPGLTISGTPFTGGTATTNFPQVYINTTGATGPTTFSTSGTLFGINSATGFSGNFMDVHLNGGASLFKITSTGSVTTGAQILATGTCAAPEYSGVSDTGTGWHLSNDGTMRFCTGSTEYLKIKGSDPILTIEAGRGLSFAGTIPTVGTCGTSPTIATGSTDSSGEITTGTATPTACTITFAAAKSNAPFCVLSSQTADSAFAYSISTTAITITTSAANSHKIDYFCTIH